MIFYTDIQTKASNYCLLNIKRYDDLRKDNKKIIFVDPDVMSLRTNSEYPLIDKLLWLANGNLKPNEYLGLDMPGDMNLPLEQEFFKSLLNEIGNLKITYNIFVEFNINGVTMKILFFG